MPASSLDLDKLRSGLTGRIVTSADADYDALRTTMYGSVDKRPGAIVRVADADDVSKVVSFARDNGVELAVRSGGHSGVGHSTTDGGIVIDLRDLTATEIDAPGRTAWVGSGQTAGEFTKALWEHRLAVGFGDTGSVGIGGITTGGGVGYLSRKYGLAIDSLLAADVVTADGKLLRASDKENPDLFWAIRGGGGNFGVITRFQFRLQPMQHYTGGMLLLPATVDTVAGFVAAAESAPEELSTIANIMPAPPMPFLPKEVQGQLVIIGMLGFTGDDEAGARAMAPFRALAEPFADFIKPMPYPEMYPPEDPDHHPTAVGQTMFMDRIGHKEAEVMLDYLQRSNASIRVVQLRVLGGAYARVPADATAYAHRASKIMVNVACFYEGEDDRPRRQKWVDDLAAALRQGDHGAYVNFVNSETEAGVRAAYPGPTWDRLRQIKAKYDPTNLFHLNQNIPPALAEAAE